MPELPEVETIVRGLTAHVVGLTIQQVDLTGHAMFEMKPEKFRQSLERRRIEKIHRHGKSMFLELVSPTSQDVYFFKIHLGMSGQFVLVPKSTARAKHTHLIIRFEDSNEELR